MSALAGHETAVASLSFDPAGQVLASGGYGGHRGVVLSLAFSEDGQVLFSGTDNAGIRLWSVRTRQSIGQGWSEHDDLEAHTGAVWGLARTPDGRRLISAGTDGTLRIWHIDLGAWPALACSFVRRNLTGTEWQDYLPGEPYRQTCTDYPAGN